MPSGAGKATSEFGDLMEGDDEGWLEDDDELMAGIEGGTQDRMSVGLGEDDGIVVPPRLGARSGGGGGGGGRERQRESRGYEDYGAC